MERASPLIAQPYTDLQTVILRACRYRMSGAGRRKLLIAPGLMGQSASSNILVYKNAATGAGHLFGSCAPDQIPAQYVQPPQLSACSCASVREQEDWWEARHVVSRQARSGPLTCPGLRARDFSIARQVLQHAAALARVEVLRKRGFWPAGVRPPCRRLRHFHAVAGFAAPPAICSVSTEPIRPGGQGVRTTSLRNLRVATDPTPSDFGLILNRTDSNL